MSPSAASTSCNRSRYLRWILNRLLFWGNIDDKWFYGPVIRFELVGLIGFFTHVADLQGGALRKLKGLYGANQALRAVSNAFNGAPVFYEEIGAFKLQDLAGAL